ncbi:MAG: segregation/condensation protein A [Chloroflexota bacterium]|nr:segregation/condensation protein A [Chloroflexota bacterium]MDE3194262.1 segregation/condensation protein A [Chloroflexota bacterium]
MTIERDDGSLVIGVRAPHVTVEGFEGPLDLLLELVEEKKLDILSVRLGDLAGEYLARVRALGQLPAAEAAAFLWLASRLVLLKARSLLPSLEPVAEEDEEVSEEELRARLIEYAAVKQRAAVLGERLRAGERAFHREGGTVELPPRGGDTDALAAAWTRVLQIALSNRREEVTIPPERYSVQQRTREIEEIVARDGSVTFATLLGDDPTLAFAIVTFMSLLDLYRRLVIDLQQDELYGEIRIQRKEVTRSGEERPGE